MRSSLAIGAALLLVSFMAAGQSRAPTDADIERANQHARQPTAAEIEAIRKQYADSASLAPPVAVAPATVNVDALPQPKIKVDVDSLARAYEANREAFAKRGLIEAPTLLIFVTLALPQPTLRLLIEQAARSRAVLVLRGLHQNSMRQTATAVQQLIGDRKVEFQIDPQAFDRFGVSTAPTFVLVKAGTSLGDCAAERCVAPTSYAVIAGDVSLDYALHTIAQREPAFTREAQLFLQRLGS